jgi:hypothetical protein
MNLFHTLSLGNRLCIEPFCVAMLDHAFADQEERAELFLVGYVVRIELAFEDSGFEFEVLFQL